MLAGLPFAYRLILHEFLQLDDVVKIIKEQAVPLQAISTGATRLLIIAHNTLGHIVVDYEAHIRFVNPHPKSDVCHYHMNVLVKEHILVAGTGFGVQSGVIRHGFNPVYL